MIKAVIFDYFGVISSDHYWETVGADKNEKTDYLELADKVNLGSLDWRDFLKKLSDKTEVPIEKLKHLYQSQSVNPEVTAIIKELHGRYKTGMVTNANADYLEPVLNKLEITDLFDSIVLSSTLGIIKPDPRIYNYCLEQVNVQPEEAIMVDDIARNVKAAQNLGMEGIVYSDPAQLKHELAELLSSS